jgi:hypothetical protein
MILNNKMKESKGECYQLEIYVRQRRRKLNVSEITNEKGGAARKKTAYVGNKRNREAEREEEERKEAENDREENVLRKETKAGRRE